jgi:hypothetical protein
LPLVPPPPSSSTLLCFLPLLCLPRPRQSSISGPPRANHWSQPRARAPAGQRPARGREIEWRWRGNPCPPRWRSRGGAAASPVGLATAPPLLPTTRGGGARRRRGAPSSPRAPELHPHTHGDGDGAGRPSPAPAIPHLRRA